MWLQNLYKWYNLYTSFFSLLSLLLCPVWSLAILLRCRNSISFFPFAIWCSCVTFYLFTLLLTYIQVVLIFYSASSVTQSCPTLCDLMDCSTPGFFVHYQLLELTQTHVHRVGDAIQTSHPLVPFSSCLQSFPASRSFPMSQFFASGGQSIGVSVSASVLPMNIQD